MPDTDLVDIDGTAPELDEEELLDLLEEEAAPPESHQDRSQHTGDPSGPDDPTDPDIL